MRPAYYIGVAFLVILSAVAGILAHAGGRCSQWEESSSFNYAMISVLGLSDLAISTEARYIRHLSLADIFSAFQDTPGGLDFLPSGSFFPPPEHIGLPGGILGE
jgi:hypothetical protein